MTSPTEPLPAVCIACGGDLTCPRALCDHDLMARGEATWVPAPPEDDAKESKGLRAEGLRALFFGVAPVFVLLAALERGSHAAAIGALAACALAALGLTGQRAREKSKRRFLAFSIPGDATGWAETRGGRWLRGEGECSSWVGVPAGFEARSSSDLLGQVSRPSAFLLLKTALLCLVSRGHIKARIARRLAWNRPGEYVFPPRVLHEHIQFFPADTAPVTAPLPWLEEHLRLAIVSLSGGSGSGEASPTSAEQNPYRSAPAEPAEPARWVELGELLLAFHRFEAGQPFHRDWLVARAASSGVEVNAAPHGTGACHPSVSPLISGGAMRRALEEAARKRRAERAASPG